MTDFSTAFPFTGGAAASEADWGLFAQLWATDGVVRGADSELAVTPTGTPDLNVHVASGEVWIQGYFGRRGATPADFAVTPHATLPRKDIVVARLNLTTHKMELLYRTGTADPAPVAPTLTRSGGIWDIALAEISLSAAATSIPAGSITDRRPWSTGARPVRTPTVGSNAQALLLPNIDQAPPSQGAMLVVPVSGTSSFDTIQSPGGLAGSMVLVLEFLGALTVTTDTGNLRLARNLTTKAGTVLTVEWDGTVWREIARSGETTTANLALMGPASGAAAAPTYRAHVQDDFPAALWSTANPSALDQFGGNITFTTNVANLLKMGKFFVYQCQITLTSNGSVGGGPAILTLPFSFSEPVEMALGTFHYLNTSGGTLYSGIAKAHDATSQVHFVYNNTALLAIAAQMLSGEKLFVNIFGKLA
jgi:hypothetical protein